MNLAQGIDFNSLMEPVALRLLGEPAQKHGHEWRYGNRGSLSIDLAKGHWFDHEANTGGGVFDLIKRQGHEQPAAWLRREGLLATPQVVGRPQPRIVKTYGYCDENGTLLFQVVRFEPKGFRQRRPDGRGGWIWNLQDTRRVPYLLPDLVKAVAAGETIYVPEGEKDVDNLRAIGFAATTNHAGCKKWRSEYSEHLRGADVVVLPDNHLEGREHGDQVVASLHGIARSIRVLDIGKHWAECPDKGDISAWLAVGGSAEKLKAIVDALPEVPTSADNQPSESKPKPKLAPPDGYCGDPGLLDDIYMFTGKFIAYPSEYAHVAHTLWIAHTHLMDAWESTPRLAFLSPEPASGKTRALEVTELLVPNPVEAVNVSPAYLFRKVGDDGAKPTILQDEVDALFGPKAKENEEIRGLFNAGHRRGAVAGRCIVRGKTVETEEISAFSALALAGLGWLPDTILSRSVIVRMRRRGLDEKVTAFRRRVHAPQGHALRDRLAVWAASVVDQMTAARPVMPNGIEDRNADVWEPLLAIADGMGGEWPKRARDAAVALVKAIEEAEPSLGLLLLADLKVLFETSTVAQTYGALATAAILEKLAALPESPWGDLHGKPITDRMLSSRLRQYGVKSKTVRIGDKTPKGYAREDLHDVWLRYLPDPARPSKAGEAQQAQQAQQTSGNGHFAQENVADDPEGEAQHCGNERNTAGGVADSERNTASERNRNIPAESTPVADVADVADVRGNRGEQVGAPDDGMPPIPDFLNRVLRQVPPDRRPALGPEGDSLDDLK
jgi:hypothetical protein